MMGGGFGGCTINIVKDEVVDAFVDQTKTSYSNMFGQQCSVYFVKLTNGTQII